MLMATFSSVVWTLVPAWLAAVSTFYQLQPLPGLTARLLLPKLGHKPMAAAVLALVNAGELCCLSCLVQLYLGSSHLGHSPAFLQRTRDTDLEVSVPEDSS